MAEVAEAQQVEEVATQASQGAEEPVPMAQPEELLSANEALQQRISVLEQQLGQLAQELEATRAGLGDAQRQGLEHLRRALLAEHTGQVVPELVTGTTPEELHASVKTAKAAFQRAAEAARQQLQAQQIPAGNPARSQEDLVGLPALAKIAYGLTRG